MFQENEGSGLEVGAKIHNTNVCTLRALLQHNYIAGSPNPLKNPVHELYIYMYMCMYVLLLVMGVSE